jgi:hypothetical protein
MAKPEAQMRLDLVSTYKDLHMKPIENTVGIGTPDVYYIEGWLELKILDEWPAKPGTIVKFKRYTQNQRLWLFDQWRLGGRSFLVLKVGQEWLVWTGMDAAPCGLVTRSELESIAILHMRTFDPQLFRYLITAPIPELEHLRKTKDLCNRVSELMKNCSSGGGGNALHRRRQQLSSKSPTTGTKTGSVVEKTRQRIPPALWESTS